MNHFFFCPIVLKRVTRTKKTLKDISSFTSEFKKFNFSSDFSLFLNQLKPYNKSFVAPWLFFCKLKNFLNSNFKKIGNWLEAGSFKIFSSQKFSNSRISQLLEKMDQQLKEHEKENFFPKKSKLEDKKINLFKPIQK